MSIDRGTAIAKEMFGHLASRNLKVDEGGSSPQELAWLIQLVRRRNAVEIGFNAGRSSFAFLSASADTRVTSFDIGRHRCVGAAKQHLDGKFPGRYSRRCGGARRALQRRRAGRRAQTSGRAGLGARALCVPGRPQIALRGPAL